MSRYLKIKRSDDAAVASEAKQDSAIIVSRGRRGTALVDHLLMLLAIPEPARPTDFCAGCVTDSWLLRHD